MKTPSFLSLETMWRIPLLGLVALTFAFFVLTPMAAFGAESIGTVVKKRADVYGTPPDSARERKFPRSGVMFSELIETSRGSAVLMRLDDHSELYLGEYATLTIDDFVYDPASQKGRAVYEFTLGTLRFVSGDMEQTQISILTPNANLGIRGSDAIIFVTPEGETIVNVLEGSFTVTSRERADVPAVTVAKGQNVSLSGMTGFSPLGTGIKMPEYNEDPAAKVPDYSESYEDVKVGGNLDRTREGREAGGGGHSSSDSDSSSSSSQ